MGEARISNGKEILEWKYQSEILRELCETKQEIKQLMFSLSRIRKQKIYSAFIIDLHSVFSKLEVRRQLSRDIGTADKE